jgi:hypothetical protein
VTIMASALLSPAALAEYTLPHCQQFKSHIDPTWHPPGWVDPKTLTDAQLAAQLEPGHGGIPADVMDEAVRRGMAQDVPQIPATSGS